MNKKQITVAATIAAPIEQAWAAYTTPSVITQWNFASDDWYCHARKRNSALVGHIIPDLSNSDPFHGIIAVHSGRRGAQRDAGRIGQAMQRTRWAAMTHPEGRALFPASYVARRLWYMNHGATRALPPETIAPVKWLAVAEIWYKARMEAKDGSFNFDYEAVYIEIEPHEALTLGMLNDRKARATFESGDAGNVVTTIFDAETENPVDRQRDSWQVIQNNFKTYVETKGAGER